MTPIDVDFPDVDEIIAGIGSFGSINEIWQSVIPSIGLGFYAKLGSITNGMAARFTDMVSRIQGAYSASMQLLPFLIPEDYNPPSYEGTSDQATSPEEELSLFKYKRDVSYIIILHSLHMNIKLVLIPLMYQFKQSFVAESRAALDMFSGTGTEYNESGVDVNISPINITDIKSKVSTVNLNFESLSDPDIDFNLWFLQFSSLLDRLVFLDYIFRAFITIRLLLKYWFATSLAMPQIDIRVNKDIKNPFRMHPARAAMTFLTSPAGSFLIFVGVGTWLALIIYALYLPLFKSYTSGCIDTNGNGTFITKNLYSLSYNHAYQEGSGLLLNGLDAFDVKRGDTCSSRYTASVALQNNINSNFTAYSNFQVELSENMGLAQRCIDGDKLNSSFLEACCGYPAYPSCTDEAQSHNITCPIDDRREISTIQMPFELPGIALREQTCSVSVQGSIWEIDDAIFDCEELASCDMTCDEPRRQVLNPATEKCGCTIEWYLHSQWLCISLALLLYFLMNVARVFFTSGLTRLLWKYIYPERFTVLVTCDSNGGLVTNSKGTSGSHDDLIKAIKLRSSSSRQTLQNEELRHLSKDLRAKFSRSLNIFYITGTAQIAASFVACGAWVYIVVVVSQSLTPRVWK